MAKGLNNIGIEKNMREELCIEVSVCGSMHTLELG